MGRQLKLGPGFVVPDDAVTQTFALFGKRGSGKTNGATVLAEAMYKARLPFVVLDPVDAWWGLKSSRDGKSAGLKVYIFGGPHGDLPLEPTAGAAWADVIIDQRISAVFSFKGWTGADRTRFAGAFAERLLMRNSEPLHVFLEEADAFIPQRPQKGEETMLGHFDRMVRWGRQSGIGCTLVTQRSAAVNKNVTTQAETLISFRVLGPQDRDAIDNWIKFHAGEEKRSEVLQTLPDLKDGQAWVWSPEWLKTLRVVKFRLRETYDSAATPKAGQKRPAPKELAEVDLEKLRAQMQAAIDRADAEDPKKLHARIRELEKERAMKDRLAVQEPKIVEVEKRVEVLKPFFDEKLAEEMAASFRQTFVDILTKASEQAQVAMDQAAARLMAAAKKRVPSTGPAHVEAIRQGLGQRKADRHTPIRESGVQERALARSATKAASNGSSDLTAAGQKILNTLGWLESVRIMEPDRTTVGAIAGYSARSGHFKNTTGALRSAGLIVYPNPDSLALTDEGREQATIPDTPPTTEDLHATLLAKLDTAQRRILEPLLAAGGQPVSREKLGEISGYSHTSGHFKNVLGSLRSMRVIEYPDAQSARASDLVFLN